LPLLRHTLKRKRKRKPKNREVMRSFRITRALDRELTAAACKRKWSKSFLIRDIIEGWLVFDRTSATVDALHAKEDAGDEG
jgi:hypothetical protein